MNCAGYNLCAAFCALQGHAQPIIDVFFRHAGGILENISTECLLLVFNRASQYRYFQFNQAKLEKTAVTHTRLSQIRHQG
jgi:hypothetical protein